MIDLNFPKGTQESHEAALSLIRKAIEGGLKPTVRVVVAKRSSGADEPWRAVCGRIDLARPADPRRVDCRPTGRFKVLNEQFDGPTFVNQVAAAFQGRPLLVQGMELADHGLDSTVRGFRYHHADGWRRHGCDWPCEVIEPSQDAPGIPWPPGLIEDEGTVELHRDWGEFLPYAMAYRDSGGPGPDSRLRRIQFIIWDYRGRIDHFDLDGDHLLVEVSPKADASLRLVGLLEGAESVPLIEDRPTTYKWTVPGLRRAHVELKVADEVVAEATKDIADEHFRRSLRGSDDKEQALAPEDSATIPTSFTVFYSWQSDRPNAANRGFIEDGLKRATKAIRKDETIEVDCVLDRDTQGVSGSPDISATIFAKIDKCQAFVADVTIIHDGDEPGRRGPNPNVMVELGYALKTLGWDRVIMVMNTAFGGVDLLPFDLPRRRIMGYELSEGASKADVRKALAGRLEGQLREMLADFEGPQTAGSMVEQVPSFEVLDAQLYTSGSGGQLEVSLYVTPRKQKDHWIVAHRCSGDLLVRNRLHLLENFQLYVPVLDGSAALQGNRRPEDQLAVDRPRRFFMVATCDQVPVVGSHSRGSLTVQMKLGFTGSDSPIPVEFDLAAPRNGKKWTLKR